MVTMEGIDRSVAEFKGEVIWLNLEFTESTL